MPVNSTTSSEIRKVKDTLTKKFKVKQLFLFGSHAYGHPDAGSDLDLCIILDLEGRRKIEWIRDIRRELMNAVSLPLDILVFGQEEFDQRANLSSTLEHQILTQGKKLYEQPGYSAGMVQGG